nr:MAG TPA: HepA-related protein (HARP) [Caudoviricetes sp.]
MTDINVKLTNDNKIEIETPYNADFVKSVKKLKGAKWNPNKYVWTVDECEMEKAVEIINEIYNTNISSDKKVTVKVTTLTKKLNGSSKTDLVIAGTTIIKDCQLADNINLTGSLRTRYSEGKAIRTFFDEGSTFTFEASEKAYKDYDYVGSDFTLELI